MPLPSFRRWLSRLFPSAVPATRSVAFRPRVDGLEDRLAPATFTVTSVANSGAGTLRQAITDANAAAGADDIVFNIAGAGVKTINLRSALPVITETVSIDGGTQPGFANLPLIAINGSKAGGGVSGLVVSGSKSDGTLIRGLVIQRFTGDGIRLLSNDNTVETCYIGTNAAGSAAAPNSGSGIAILGSASDNTIGGLAQFTGNLISGNKQNGILLRGLGVSNNLVAGNAVGLNAALTVLVPNKVDGIAILQGANNNIIGDTAGLNDIEGNGRHGINISGLGSDGNLVTENTIAFNRSNGILISGGASNNNIDNFNVMSGNRANGIVISGAGTSGNTVRNNRIGLNFGGTTAVANGTDGVLINGGASGNTIGGPNAADANFISGNTRFGINISGTGTSGNTVQGNFIGTDLAGAVAVGNRSSGVQVGGGASGNTIGGSAAGERNLISGNKAHGLVITGAGTSGNTAQGNLIGTNLAGTAALGNKLDGIVVSGKAALNTIGGAGAGEGNTISGNLRNGVNISGAATSGNSLIGNTIGLDLPGTAALANKSNGVQIASGAHGNTLSGNTISGNTRVGVLISGANGTIVQGNKIGTDEAGAAPFANGSHGVFITNKAAGSFIGGTLPGDGNTIANNAGTGVLIGSDPSAGFRVLAGVGNAVLGNSITANGQRGIDLGPRSGPLPNDNRDPDRGPNNLQNSPTVTAATIIVGTSITFSVQLSSLPNTTFRIELFASATADGEGQEFIGAIDVTTDASGLATGSDTIPYTPAVFLASITATATNLTTNDTSEFSPVFTAT
jgi:parallel beta-helix repeat protein